MASASGMLSFLTGYELASLNGYVLACRANAVCFAFVYEEQTYTVTRDLIRNSPKYRGE